MIQSLAHQDDILPGTHQRLKLAHTLRLELRLQVVLEVFFAQQIKAVAADAPQHAVHHAGGKFPVQRIQERAQHSHQKDQTATGPAFGKGLQIPGKERNRPDGGQFKQAALDPPVHGVIMAGAARIFLGQFQRPFLPETCTLEPARETKVFIVNNRGQSAKLLSTETAKCPECIGLAAAWNANLCWRKQSDEVSRKLRRFRQVAVCSRL